MNTGHETVHNAPYPYSIKEQWLKLLDMTDDIRTFISVHESELKAKEDKLKE